MLQLDRDYEPPAGRRAPRDRRSRSSARTSSRREPRRACRPSRPRSRQACNPRPCERVRTPRERSSHDDQTASAGSRPRGGRLLGDPASASAAHSRRRLLFCSDISYPPEEFVPERQEPRLRHRHRHRGREADGHDQAKFQNTGFDGIVAALLSNKCDAIISGMNDTPARAQEHLVRRLPQRRPVAHREEGQSAAHQRRRSTSAARRRRSPGRDDEPADAADVRQAVQGEGQERGSRSSRTRKIRSASWRLQTGHIDVYESDSPPAVWYTTKNTAIQIVGKPITPQPVGIGIMPKDTALKAQIQKAINAMYKNGTMLKILKKWNMAAFALKEVTLAHGEDGDAHAGRSGRLAPAEAADLRSEPCVRSGADPHRVHRRRRPVRSACSSGSRRRCSQMSRWRVFRLLSYIYVLLVRGTPLIVQIFFMYYGANLLLGFTLFPRSGELRALLARRRRRRRHRRALRSTRART